VGTPFTRGIEVQVLVNLEYKDKKTGAVTATSHGDVFSIMGATCKPDRPHPQGWSRCLPSEHRAKGGGEWNHYRIVANDGVIKLSVNGKEVSGVSQCNPRKGYLALESEGAECHFRNIRIKELPSTNPKPEQVANEAKDFKNLFTGLDLSGWKTDGAAMKHWQPKDWVLHFDGPGEAKDVALRTEKEHGDAEFVVDYRFPPKKDAGCTIGLRDGDNLELTLTPAGKVTVLAPGTRAGRDAPGVKPAGQWNRLQVAIKGPAVEVTVNGQFVLSMKRSGLPAKGTFALRPEGAMDFGNLFVRERK
jgi:3-keto-disaccharide hydrolase